MGTCGKGLHGKQAEPHHATHLYNDLAKTRVRGGYKRSSKDLMGNISPKANTSETIVACPEAG